VWRTDLLHSELEKCIDVVEVNHTITLSVARFNERDVKLENVLFGISNTSCIFIVCHNFLPSYQPHSSKCEYLFCLITLL
jgi:hypothetical protein